MENQNSSVHSRRPPAAPRTHRSRTPKTGRGPEAMKNGRQKPKSEVKAERAGAGVNLKSTVVDIDRVRDDQVREEENLGQLEAAEQEDGSERTDLGACEWLLMVLVFALVLVFLPVTIWFCVKIVREHERAVIYRLGHLLRGRPRGPGLLFYLPLLDVCHKVDVRLTMLKVPFHTVVTQDLLRPELSAVCYYRIENVALCRTALSGLTAALQSVVQAAVRDVLARHALGHVLPHRRSVAQQIRTAADAVTCRWGVHVERVDIDELSFPEELQQSLAADAEARRRQQVKAAEADTTSWEGLRASFRHLHPALVLPLSSDLLSLNSDHMSLPPPPPSPLPPPLPPVVDEEGRTTEGGRATDSPMM